MKTMMEIISNAQNASPDVPPGYLDKILQSVFNDIGLVSETQVPQLGGNPEDLRNVLSVFIEQHGFHKLGPLIDEVMKRRKPLLGYMNTLQTTQSSFNFEVRMGKKVCDVSKSEWVEDTFVIELAKPKYIDIPDMKEMLLDQAEVVLDGKHFKIKKVRFDSVWQELIIETDTPKPKLIDLSVIDTEDVKVTLGKNILRVKNIDYNAEEEKLHIDLEQPRDRKITKDFSDIDYRMIGHTDGLTIEGILEENYHEKEYKFDIEVSSAHDIPFGREIAVYIADFPQPFQDRVGQWLAECFGKQNVNNLEERIDRFVEESLELVQSLNYPLDRVRALTNYVENRDIGIPFKEVGGVMTTLAALCHVKNISMAIAAKNEYDRITSPVVMKAIRRKQSQKPTADTLIKDYFQDDAKPPKRTTRRFK